MMVFQEIFIFQEKNVILGSVYFVSCIFDLSLNRNFEKKNLNRNGCLRSFCTKFWLLRASQFVETAVDLILSSACNHVWKVMFDDSIPFFFIMEWDCFGKSFMELICLMEDSQD
ncbi:hypothetical protein SAY87_010023 [Trapa incisa]|uniref:Uncharacterized protein n=1 Tax=Trapa incisa TaxID=236973 RepID=A0AAN7GE04_9MYRT|nr:hypothetical protein SAY87_010023 [Trapa incisa]